MLTIEQVTLALITGNNYTDAAAITKQAAEIVAAVNGRADELETATARIAELESQRDTALANLSDVAAARDQLQSQLDALNAKMTGVVALADRCARLAGAKDELATLAQVAPVEAAAANAAPMADATIKP